MDNIEERVARKRAREDAANTANTNEKSSAPSKINKALKPITTTLGFSKDDTNKKVPLMIYCRTDIKNNLKLEAMKKNISSVSEIVNEIIENYLKSQGYYG